MDKASTDSSIQSVFPLHHELAPKEKTPKTWALQKGSLELGLQQKGKLFLLTSSHQQKNTCKRPALLASLENNSGANLWRPSPDQHSSSSPKRYIHPLSLTTASANKATRSSPPSFGAKTASLRNHQLLFCSDTEEEQSRARSPHPPAEPAPRHKAAPVPAATCYHGIRHRQHFTRGAPWAPEPSKAPLPRAVLVTLRR